MQRKGMIISLQLWWGKIAAVIPPVEVKCANSTKKRRQFCRDLFFFFVFCRTDVFLYFSTEQLRHGWKIWRNICFSTHFSTSSVWSFLPFCLGPALCFLLHSQSSACQLSSTLMRTTWRMAQSTHKHMRFSPFTHKPPAGPHPLSWGSHMVSFSHTPGGFSWSKPCASTTQPQHRQRRDLGVWIGTRAYFSVHSYP